MLSITVDCPMVREAGPNKVRQPAEVAAQCGELSRAGQELFIVLDLDTKNRIIDKRLVSMGLLDASLVHPREVFRGAIANSAAAVILAHNHPSGDTTPSAEDLSVTRQLVEAGRILGIRVLDHVIIGRPLPEHPTGYMSLREAGLASFEG